MDFNMAIGGIALVGVITGLIELAKRLGLDKKYAPYLNGILSLGAFLLVQYVETTPSALELAVVALQALVVFLAASGLYHEVSHGSRSRAEPT